MKRDQLAKLMELKVKDEYIRELMKQKENVIEEIINKVSKNQASVGLEDVLWYCTEASYFEDNEFQIELIRILFACSNDKNLLDSIGSFLDKVWSYEEFTDRDILRLTNRVLYANSKTRDGIIHFITNEDENVHTNYEMNDILKLADEIAQANSEDKAEAMAVIASNNYDSEISDVIRLMRTISNMNPSMINCHFNLYTLLNSMSEIAIDSAVLGNRTIEEIVTLMKALEQAETHDELDDMLQIATDSDVLEHRSSEAQLKLMKKITEPEANMELVRTLAVHLTLLGKATLEQQLRFMDELKQAKTKKQIEEIVHILQSFNSDGPFHEDRVLKLSKELLTTDVDYQVDKMADIATSSIVAESTTIEEQIELMEEIKKAKSFDQADFMAEVATDQDSFRKDENEKRILSHKLHLELLGLFTGFTSRERMGHLYDCIDVKKYPNREIDDYRKMRDALNRADDTHVTCIYQILVNQDIWTYRTTNEVMNLLEPIYQEEVNHLPVMRNVICSKNVLELRTVEEQKKLLSILSKTKESPEKLVAIGRIMNDYANVPMEEHLLDLCLYLEKENDKESQNGRISASDAPLEDILTYLDFIEKDSFDETTMIPAKVKKIRKQK